MDPEQPQDITPKQREFLASVRDRRRAKAVARRQALIGRTRALRNSRTTTLAAILGCVVVLGVILRLAQPQTVFAWANLMILTVASMAWLLWFRGGRGRMWIARRQPATREAAPSRRLKGKAKERALKKAAKSPSYLSRQALGCGLLFVFFVLENLLAAATGLPSDLRTGRADPGTLLMIFVTPLILIHLLEDSIRQVGRGVQVQVRFERAENAVVKVTNIMRANRDHDADHPDRPSTTAHPYLSQITSDSLGGNAGRRHLRRVARDDPDPERRIAAELLLQKLEA